MIEIVTFLSEILPLPKRTRESFLGGILPLKFVALCVRAQSDEIHLLRDFDFNFPACCRVTVEKVGFFIHHNDISIINFKNIALA